jgi:hypothetical protein
MEYNRAVTLKKPRLIFFNHDDHEFKSKDFETGPGAAKLQSLKDRIGKDRVAALFKSADDLRGHVFAALTSLAKELDRPSGAVAGTVAVMAPVISKTDYVLLAQTLSTVIVDLFRMLYVLGSDEATAANMSRFGYLFEITDEHTKELSSQLARLASGLAASDREMITRIERACLWVLGQIRPRKDVNFDVNRCFSVMSDVVNDAYKVFRRIISEDLSRVEGEVFRAFRHSVPDHRLGSIETLRLRLSVQSAILKDIGTIAHDPLQSYSLHYFLIDHRLLSKSP